MAIKTVEMDSRDSVSYRGYLKRCGYISASYLSVSGFDASVDVTEYREGNERPTTRKVQGLRKFGNASTQTTKNHGKKTF